MNTVDDACAVEAEVGGDEVSSPDATVGKEDSGNNLTETNLTEAGDVSKATG